MEPEQGEFINDSLHGLPKLCKSQSYPTCQVPKDRDKVDECCYESHPLQSMDREDSCQQRGENLHGLSMDSKSQTHPTCDSLKRRDFDDKDDISTDQDEDANGNAERQSLMTQSVEKPGGHLHTDSRPKSKRRRIISFGCNSSKSDSLGWDSTPGGNAIRWGKQGLCAQKDTSRERHPSGVRCNCVQSL